MNEDNVISFKNPQESVSAPPTVRCQFYDNDGNEIGVIFVEDGQLKFGGTNIHESAKIFFNEVLKQHLPK